MEDRAELTPRQGRWGRPATGAAMVKADEIHLKEMSTHRMKGPRAELFITMWVTGPRGGGRGMLRFDRAEADKLLKQLARACAHLEEAATAALYADNFRRRAKPPATRKRKKKVSHDQAR